MLLNRRRRRSSWQVRGRATKHKQLQQKSRNRVLFIKKLSNLNRLFRKVFSLYNQTIKRKKCVLQFLFYNVNITWRSDIRPTEVQLKKSSKGAREGDNGRPRMSETEPGPMTTLFSNNGLCMRKDYPLCFLIFDCHRDIRKQMNGGRLRWGYGPWEAERSRGEMVRKT